MNRATQKFGPVRSKVATQDATGWLAAGHYPQHFCRSVQNAGSQGPPNLIALGPGNGIAGSWVAAEGGWGFRAAALRPGNGIAVGLWGGLLFSGGGTLGGFALGGALSAGRRSSLRVALNLHPPPASSVATQLGAREMAHRTMTQAIQLCPVARPDLSLLFLLVQHRES